MLVGSLLDWNNVNLLCVGHCVNNNPLDNLGQTRIYNQGLWHDVVPDLVSHEPGVHVAGITPPGHLILLTPTLQLTLGCCEKGSNNIAILIGNGVMFAM
jgi:hypothetical protein